jgi:hypothetical protein
MANTITVSQISSTSSNVGYAFPPFYDEYVAISNVEEMLVGTYTTINLLSNKDYLSTSSNVGYAFPPFYDEYVVISNVQEMLVGNYNNINLLSDRVPLTNLTYQTIPSPTYVVSDGNPILLVSVFNTQYWSTS